MSKKAAVIGRFQVPQLHSGHEKLFSEIFLNHQTEDLTILVGCSRGRFDPRYPYTFSQIQTMLRKYVGFLPKIYPLWDIPWDDQQWSEQVDSYLDVDNTTIYAGPDSFAPHYSGKCKVLVLPFRKDISGTQVRLNYKDGFLSNLDQRVGWLQAMNNIPPLVYPTVDAVVMIGDKMVLGRKTDQSQWRLVGGFVDPTDKSYENAIRREIQEELKIYISDIRPVHYIGSYAVDDPRYTGTGHQIMTSLFAVLLEEGFTPTAGDDLAQVRLFDPPAEVDIVPEHEKLLVAFNAWRILNGQRNSSDRLL